jgi:hypothetical protein
VRDHKAFTLSVANRRKIRAPVCYQSADFFS